MLFKNYFNWLKFTTVTPSTHFRNRLFIEKSMRSNSIYSFVGETQKSFSWVQTSSTNLSLFWLRTSRKRLFMFILLILLILFFIVINTNNLSTALQSSILKFLFYLFWRAFDWLYFFLIQLQYLVVTVLVSCLLVILNWFLSSKLSLSSWVQKHHAEFTPSYLKTKSSLTNVSTKADFGLLLTTTRNSITSFYGNGYANAAELFNYPRTSLGEFTALSNYFKTYFLLLFSIVHPNLPTVGYSKVLKNPLFSDSFNKFNFKETGPNPFALNSLLKTENTLKTLVMPNRQIWEPLGNSFFFTGSRHITKELYNYIRITRWVALNVTSNRSELVNNESLVASLNMAKKLPGVCKMRFVFNSKEWFDYRSNLLLHPFSLRKLYRQSKLSSPDLVLTGRISKKVHLPNNYLKGVFITESPTILVTNLVTKSKKSMTLHEPGSYSAYWNLTNLTHILTYKLDTSYLVVSTSYALQTLPYKTTVTTRIF